MSYEIFTVRDIPTLSRSKHDDLGKRLLELEPGSEEGIKIVCSTKEDMASVAAYVYGRASNGTRYTITNDPKELTAYVHRRPA